MSLLPHLSQAISNPCSPMFKLVPFCPRAPLARDPYNLWQTEQIVRSRPGSEELAPASYACWAPTKLRYARSIQLCRMDIEHTKQVTRKQWQNQKMATAKQPTMLLLSTLNPSKPFRITNRGPNAQLRGSWININTNIHMSSRLPLSCKLKRYLQMWVGCDMLSWNMLRSFYHILPLSSIINHCHTVSIRYYFGPSPSGW